MRSYAVELYAPRAVALEAGRRIGSAAGQMRSEGTSIRYMRSVFLRDDEICFLLVDAASVGAIAEAARRAAVTFDRVLEVDVAAATRPAGRE